ncbi:MAG TPA: M20/M25/M40 family metallo-hydrolase [Acetobacteraceae bacterium]|jgi:succinyl-diaminopimelate desuccinylase
MAAPTVMAGSRSPKGVFMMDATKRLLLERIEADKETLIDFLRGFIRCKSPNPPGDTRDAAAFVRGFLDAHALDYRVIAPNEVMPNIVASFDAATPGRHLALNGHMDVFPVGDGSGWNVDPWGGDLLDGKIFGRGACDMKCGTTAALFTFLYLHELRHALHGKLTLSAVSDEETFGPWGARYLVEHHPEILGDCCLSGEPSSRYTVRFGEKGPLWLRFRVRTPGAHGAFTHASASAVAIAARIIGELGRLEHIEPPRISNLSAALAQAADVMDAAHGQGASRVVQRVTVNPGLIQGGLKVNMVAADCMFEVDIRLPSGLDEIPILREVDRIVAAQPEVSYEKILYNPPNWCPPDTEMAGYVRANAKEVAGIDPVPVISLGCTDTRLWRYAEIPAIVYGPAPAGMGSTDEHVSVDDLLHVVRCHVLSAYDYMMRPG